MRHPSRARTATHISRSRMRRQKTFRSDVMCQSDMVEIIAELQITTVDRRQSMLMRMTLRLSIKWLWMTVQIQQFILISRRNRHSTLSLIYIRRVFRRRLYCPLCTHGAVQPTPFWGTMTARLYPTQMVNTHTGFKGANTQSVLIS